MIRHRHNWVVTRTDKFSDLIVRVLMCTVCYQRRAENSPR